VENGFLTFHVISIEPRNLEEIRIARIVGREDRKKKILGAPA